MIRLINVFTPALAAKSRRRLAPRPRKGCLALGCALILLVLGASVANAAFPGRNGRIAYHDLNEECVLRDDDCSESSYDTVLPTREGQRHLVHDASHVAFSPDGRWIAYTTLEMGVALMRADGPEEERALIDLDEYPDWAPTGDRLVGHGFDKFVDRLATLRIYHRKRGRSRSRSRRLTRGLYPAWSIHNRIAFFRHDGLYVIRPDGTGLRGISADPATVRNTGYLGYGDPPSDQVTGDDLDWSPDGRWLVFDGPRTGAAIRPPLTSDVSVRSIFKIRADGTGLSHLGEGIAPSFAPDGSSIVFNKGYTNLMVMGTDGSRPRTIGRGGLASDWQPLLHRDERGFMSTLAIALVTTAVFVLAALAGIIHRKRRPRLPSREHP